VIVSGVDVAFGAAKRVKAIGRDHGSKRSIAEKGKSDEKESARPLPNHSEAHLGLYVYDLAPAGLTTLAR